MNFNEIVFWLIIFFYIAPRCVLIIAFYHEYTHNLRDKKELYSAVITALLFSEFFMLYLFFSFLECVFTITSNKIENFIVFIESKIRKFIKRFL